MIFFTIAKWDSSLEKEKGKNIIFGGVTVLEPLVKPVESVKYEIASQMISSLLQKGLISKIEFDAIDKENMKSFIEDKRLD